MLRGRFSMLLCFPGLLAVVGLDGLRLPMSFDIPIVAYWIAVLVTQDAFFIRRGANDVDAIRDYARRGLSHGEILLNSEVLSICGQSEELRALAPGVVSVRVFQGFFWTPIKLGAFPGLSRLWFFWAPITLGAFFVPKITKGLVLRVARALVLEVARAFVHGVARVVWLGAAKALLETYQIRSFFVLEVVRALLRNTVACPLSMSGFGDNNRNGNHAHGVFWAWGGVGNHTASLA
ncbi:hypothetical protein U1Q18_020646 [Sarracenia purpurea var. burkii]